MAKKEIIFQEAEPADASAFLAFMNKVAQETDYLVMDETGFPYSEEETAEILFQSLEKDNRLCLVAKIEDEIIGVVNVRADSPYRISHIGTIFIAVLKDYWGHGIGRILLEDVVAWAEEVKLLNRLELTVQVRNERAVYLYQSCGFEIEGLQKRGARTDEGEWLDLYYMGRLVD